MSFGKRFSIMVLTLPKKLLLRSGFHTILKRNAYDSPTLTPTQSLKISSKLTHKFSLTIHRFRNSCYPVYMEKRFPVFFPHNLYFQTSFILLTPIYFFHFGYHLSIFPQTQCDTPSILDDGICL